MADISNINLPDGSSYNIKDASVPHSSLPASSGGTDLSLVTTGEKYAWANSTLAGLSDVDINTTTLTNGSVLIYDSVSDKWINTEETLYISDTQVRVSDTYDTTSSKKTTKLNKSGVSHTTSGSFKSHFGISGTTRGFLLQNSSSKDRLKISYAPTLDYVYEIFYTEGGLEGTTITPYSISNTSGSFSSVSATTLNGVTIGNSPVFTDTTYTFASGTNGFTVTPSGGTAQTVTVTPSITNNVTGSGTSGYLAKFNGANTITNAVALGSDTTKYLRNDGTWAVPPDNNTTYSAGTGVTISGNNNAINVSYGTTATTACVGNDSRLSDARTPTSHTHGNIQNGGTLQTNDITIANGDKIVVTDSSDSSKIARTSIAFDGSTATKALTQKGTWETFGTSNLTLGTTSTTALKGDTKYAGASTAGGSATSAAKLDTATAGSATQPCYFANGVPSACTYSLNKTVPADAVFTDVSGNNKLPLTGGTLTGSLILKDTILYVTNAQQDSRAILWVGGNDDGVLDIYNTSGTATISLAGHEGKITCNSMNVENISSLYSSSKSSGALGAATITAYRTGNVVQMNISFAKNSTTSQSVGTNIWVGTISGGPLPIDTISLMGYYSSAILQCQITSAGAVNVRIQGSAAQFTSAASVNGTFIIPET